LAIAISTISGFNTANKLFQYPAFTITVGLIICIMAVGMSGFFSLGLPSWVYRVNPSQESVGGAFLFGVMTAVLSTPCTAPFMGAAAAWAATQSPAITIATFVAIGSGMALPYLLLSAFPALVNRMPRSGPASDLIKQVMGVLLLAAGAYFVGTGVAGLFAKPPDPPSQAYWWAVGAFITVAGAWLAWRTVYLSRLMTNRLIFCGVGVLLLVAGMSVAIRFTRGSPIRWIYYTPERLAAAQTQKKIVVLDFTAAWCLNCHALEQGVLHDKRVVALLNTTNVAPIKIDVTGNNPAGSRKLLEVGRLTIPYLVVYAPDGRKVFSSDAYTVDQVIAAVESADSLSSEAGMLEELAPD
jgi:thiol:disulfide interchange protein